MSLLSKAKSFLAIQVEPHRVDREFVWGYRNFQFIEAINPADDFTQEAVRFGNNSLAFLIPKFNAYSGGITSILRLGTYLAELGHSVSYVVYEEADTRRMAENAAKCLPYYKGQVVGRDELHGSYDFGIATYWASVYFMLGHRSHFKQSAYFVQDYEPGFFPEGDVYYLARNTYAYNLRMISLGSWNQRRIEQVVPGARVDSVDFPYEGQQYFSSPRTIVIGDTLKMAVYIKFIPSRAPMLILHSLSLLKERLAKRGVTLEANIFGVDSSRTLPVGRNLGKLGAAELNALYQQCHLGLVSSLTNISLVPYEMIACGLPVVEMSDGSAPAFVPADAMIFARSIPLDMCQKIEHSLDHQDKLNELAANGRKFIEQKTWANSAAQFNRLLEAVLQRLLLMSALIEWMMSRAVRVRCHATHLIHPDFISDKTIVLDLGANHGAFSHSLAAEYGATCHMVEANPHLVKLLEQQPGVQVLWAAAVGKPRTLEFIVRDNDEASSISFDADRRGSTVTVTGINYADIMSRFALTRIDVLKMDIEGSEIEVIDGMTDAQLLAIGQLTIEFHDSMGHYPTSETTRVLGRLGRMGFLDFRIQKDSTLDVLLINRHRYPRAFAEWCRLKVLTRPMGWVYFGLRWHLARRGLG